MACVRPPAAQPAHCHHASPRGHAAVPGAPSPGQPHTSVALFATRAGAHFPVAPFSARAASRAGPSAIESPRPGPSAREAPHAALPARPQAAELRRRRPFAKARPQGAAPGALRPVPSRGAGRSTRTSASRATAPSPASPPRATRREPPGPREHTKACSPGPEACPAGPTVGPVFTAPTRAASAALPAAAARAQANAASAAWLHGSAALRAMPRTSNRSPGARDCPFEAASPHSTP